MIRHFSHKQGGLVKKYSIFKVKDGSLFPVSEEGTYFVLRLDTDPFARKAMKVYSNSIFKSNPELSNDISNLLQVSLKAFKARNKIDKIIKSRDANKQ